MIITRLTLYNFGIYKGTNQFEFENRKPVILIGGMNGRGKTTFLEAVLLALYGSSSYAYTESGYRTYGQYLNSYVNKSDHTLFTYVELSFKMSAHLEEQYTVRREWSGKGQRIRDKIIVQKNGADDPFLTEHWSLFIESVFPSGLSNFFFFNGEKIAELAVEDTSAQMKDSIRALLGIKVLDRLENDLGRVAAKAAKSSGSGFDSDELERIRTLKMQAEASLQSADEEIAVLEQKLSDCQKEFIKANNAYVAKGGNLVSQQQKLFWQRSEITAKSAQLYEDLLDQTSGELPLCLIPDLLEEICAQAEKEREQEITESALAKISKISEQFLLQFQTEASSIERFVAFAKERTGKEYVEPIYNLSNQAWVQAKHLYEVQLEKERKNAGELAKQLKKLQNKLGEIDNYLSVDIDEKAIARIYKQIKKLEQVQMDLNAQLEYKQKKRASLHSEAIRANAEYNRYVESALKSLELSDDSGRIIAYSQKAISLLKKYRVCLQENKIRLLAETMTECYHKLASKKNLIDKITMDPVTLDFQYTNAKGDVIPKTSLSAGEMQLMVISLLWSLALSSKWKLPVIIDTPLSRLDSVHRLSLINIYFPQASEQTIILSTDTEIDGYYYSAMKDSVGDEYTLVYDETNQCSTIQKGYFVGEKS